MPETHARAYLAADLVALGVDPDGGVQVLVIVRGGSANPGRLGLPGGHLEQDEDPLQAALREAREETGLDFSHLEPKFVSFDADPKPSPRGRYVTFAYVVVVPVMEKPTAGDDARDAMWLPVDDLNLVYNHNKILAKALTVTGLDQ